MKIILYSLLAISVIVLIYYGSKYYKNKDLQKVSGGSAPRQEDIDCATGGGGGEGKRIIGNCTKPVIYPVVKPMKEKCFTADELGITKEGQAGPPIVTENNGFGTTWYLNYQSGDRFCYRSPQFYK